MDPSISRRRALSALAGAALAPCRTEAQPRRPNIIILYADDMGYHDAGFNGRKEWRTPNLDRLGAQGIVFDRWYTGMPLCAPSRACLLTGKYTIHHTVRGNNVDIPASEVTIAEALKPLGYNTALFGKWHGVKVKAGGGPHPLDQGFDETFGYLDARHAWEHFPKELFRGRESQPVKGFSSDLLADETIRFMRRHKQDPFFIYVPFIEPHFLIEAPPEEVARFKGKFTEKDPNNPVNAAYAAMIEHMDRSIGRILAELETLGLAKDTLVFFSSDNGATFETGNRGTANYHDSNRPFRGQKRSLEEGGIRMPTCMRWPGRIPAGKRSQDVMSMIDLLPSFVAAAGGKVDPAWKVDGMNMLDVWTGKTKVPERTVFWEFQTESIHMYAAMRGDFKLLEIGDNRFLYNLKDDPQERRTVAQEYPDLFKQLVKELRDWMATEVK